MVDETSADEIPVIEPPTDHEALIEAVRATLADESGAGLESETGSER
jgi:hypothetical protein